MLYSHISSVHLNRPVTIEADPRFVIYLYIQSAWEFAKGVLVLLVYTTQRWRFHNGRGGWNPTLAFNHVVYFYYISEGVDYIYQGCIFIAVLGDINMGIAQCVGFVIEAVPYIAALLYGRKTLFKVVARKFEDKRRGLDSAVIAELMNDPALRVGADWWTHHGRNRVDEYPDLFDHRRNWIRAVVVEIEDSRFSINPNVVQRRLGVGFAQGGAAAVRRGSLVGWGGGGSFFGRRRSSASYTVGGGGGGSFFGRGKVAPVPATLEWIARNEDAKEDAVGLLTKAHKSLRTLGGQDLTRGLMAKCVVRETEVVFGKNAVTLTSA